MSGGKIGLTDFVYKNTEQHRVWQAWIGTSTASPIFELEVRYPAGVLQRNDGRGYLFRLALEWASSEADRANNAFSGELTEKDDIVLRLSGTQLLKLPVPS
ncbi:hypothetical protein [Pseudomonas kitaguniensis]|uniref:hypothetical protein n=1 Tax=Pseudomonas kitaguniensis TaxID=2607908 RepID=UPI001561C994|nr:hypothetical protein [Pseudomonas kitaguniensis]